MMQGGDMGITPRGMSVQEAYRLYRDSKLIVNRRYQRKLVWTEPEKVRLIDSILNDYPILLILLAVHSTDPSGDVEYEIIDGMQRLQAIFSFIENGYPLTDKRYFDVEEFPRAKLAADQGSFKTVSSEHPKIKREECANLLDYQLAITIYPTTDPVKITEVFGRINSSGKQLSPQERRQAGIVTLFADFVRKVASEIRGDDSPEVVLLYNMPGISIGTKAYNQEYGLRAEETFWCKQGILWTASLRNSHDEDMIADITASVLFNQPFKRSQEALDNLYDPHHSSFERVERELASYGAERLAKEIKSTLAILEDVITRYDSEENALRRVVSGIRNELKTPFFAIFMAFFDLVVKQGKSPIDAHGIMNALKGVGKEMTASRHYTLSEDREKNVNKTIGLIQKYFAHKDPPALQHGPGLAVDFENALRRSRIETPRYEFKQGILRLDETRTVDDNLLSRIIETFCAIANSGPHIDGYLYIGVADKEPDARRIEALDNVHPVDINGRFVVGIDRELNHLDCSHEAYVDKLLNKIRHSELSDPLKSQILRMCDTVDYRGFSVIRFVIPKQKDPSFVGNKMFVREGSSTKEVMGPDTLSVFQSFQSSS
jgi:hypothetical protein